MKIKIIKPVKIHKQDSVVDLDDKAAKQLIAGEFVVEHKEPPPAPPIQPEDAPK